MKEIFILSCPYLFVGFCMIAAAVIFPDSHKI